MGSIPLVTSLFDPRNILTILTIMGILIIAARCAYPWTNVKQALALSMVSFHQI